MDLDLGINLTGSLNGVVGPLLETAYGSVDEGTGSSVLDTVLTLPAVLYTAVVGLLASGGADLGSSMLPPA